MAMRPGKAKGPSTSSGSGGGGGGGTVTGTGAANQVAFWTTPINISGNNNFRYNGTNLSLGNVAPDPSFSFFIDNPALIGSQQFGLVNIHRVAADASALSIGYYVRTETASSGAPWTLNKSIGLGIASTGKGTNSTINTDIGLEISSVLGGSVANYAILTNFGTVRFGDAVEATSTLEVTGTARFNGSVAIGSVPHVLTRLTVTPTMSGFAQPFGTIIGPIFTSAANFGGAAVLAYVEMQASGSPYNTNDAIAFQAASIILGSNANVLNAYGLKVENVSVGSVLNRAIHTAAGKIRFGDLTSGSTQMVVADTDGVLGIQPIPGGGSGITGAGVANQVTFWNGPTTVTGSNLLQWNGTTLAVQGDITTTGNVVSLPLGFLAGSYVQVSGVVATDRDFFRMQTSLSNRFVIRVDATAESGSNAGSNFNLRAYNDGGALIDTPLSIVRAAAGILTITRPSSLTSTLAVTGLSTLTGGVYTTKTGSSANAGFQVDANNPSISLRSASAAANNRFWNILLTGTQFEILPANDVGSTGSFFTASRSANTITLLAITATAMTQSGTLAVTGNLTIATSKLVVTASTGDTVSAGQIKSTQTGFGSLAGVVVEATANVSIALIESGAAAANRRWGMAVASEQLRFQVLSDANSAFAWLTVDRTANAIDNATFNAYVNVNNHLIVGAPFPTKNAAVALQAAGYAMTGTTQYSFIATGGANTGATVLGAAVVAKLEIANAVATAQGMGVLIQSASLGSGSGITTNYGLYIEDQTVGATDYALFTNAGLIRLGDTVLFLNDLVANATNALIRSDTGDGSDTKAIHLTGGGTADESRGAIVSVFGNEFSATEGGRVRISAGAAGVGPGDLHLLTGGISRFSIDPTGLFSFTGAPPSGAGTGAVTIGNLSGSITTTVTVTASGTLGRSAALVVLGTGQVVATTSGDALSAGLISESTLPFVAWHETDAAVDQGWWAMGAQTNQFRFVAFNDAGGAITNIFTVDRTGATPTLLTLGAALLSTVNGGDTLSGIRIASALPSYAWTETDAPLNEKGWDFVAQGSRLSLRTFNDAGSTNLDILTVDRVGDTPTLVRIVRNISTLETLITAASTAARAGFRILPGVAPAAPINGDVWIDAGGDVRVRILGVTKRFVLV